MTLTAAEQKIHDRAVSLGHSHRSVEAELIEVILAVKQTAIFQKLDVSGVFEYAMRFLGFAESTAYALKAISRACEDIPALRQAIASLRINLAKAKRLLSVLDDDNAKWLLKFAEGASFRDIERRVAGIKPRPATKTKITHLSDGTVKLTTCFDEDTLKLHERVRALEAQRGNHGDFQKELYELYLKHRDPVRKAGRVRKITVKPKDSARAEKRRVPLTAAEKHAVFARDQGGARMSRGMENGAGRIDTLKCITSSR